MPKPTAEETFRVLPHRMPKSVTRYIRPASGPTKAQATRPKLNNQVLRAAASAAFRRSRDGRTA